MRNLSALNDSEVIREAQQGNRTAFDELVCRYDKQVLSLAARYVNQADEAKDIYQEVFLRVYKGLNKFQSRSEFATWLYRITTNVCITHGTRRTKQAQRTKHQHHHDDETESHTEIGVSQHETDRHTLNAEISTRVHNALNVLSPQQKMVFTLKHYEGYKLREIAGMLDCSEGTVKKHLFTATQRMRLQLKDLYE
jgi:RNA polymerase sigma-70 factor (ECF subfamily)